MAIEKNQTQPESIVHRTDPRNPSIKLLRKKLTDWPRGPQIFVHNGTWKQAHRLTQRPSFVLQMEMKSCYWKKAHKLAQRLLTSAPMLTWSSNSATWKQAHKLPQKPSFFQRFRSQKLRWPSLATVVLARLASTSKLAEVADVVVVVLLSCWWC